MPSESVRSGLDTQRPTAMKVTNMKVPAAGRRALSRRIVLPPIRALSFIWQWHYLLTMIIALAVVVAAGAATFSYISKLQKRDEFGSRQFNDMTRKCFADAAYPIQVSKACHFLSDRYFYECLPIYCLRAQYNLTSDGRIVPHVATASVVKVFQPQIADECMPEQKHLGVQYACQQGGAGQKLACLPYSTYDAAAVPLISVPTTPKNKARWEHDDDSANRCLKESANKDLNDLLRVAKPSQCPSPDAPNPSNSCTQSRAVLLRLRVLRCEYDYRSAVKYCRGPSVRIERCQVCPNFQNVTLSSSAAFVCGAEKAVTEASQPCRVKCGGGAKVNDLPDGTPCGGARRFGAKMFCFAGRCVFTHNVAQFANEL